MQLELLNISKSYNSRNVLKNVNITFTKGITGILGLNGSGKSTLLKILSGFVYKDSGEVLLNGRSVDLQSSLWKMEFGYLPQMPPFYERMNLIEFLDYILLVSNCKNKEERELRIRRIIEKFNLESFTNLPIGNLSGGIRQRVAIAHSIIHDPNIFLLDEPINNLDIEGRIALHNYLLENISDKIILYVGHAFEEMNELCSKVAIVDKSEIVFYDSPAVLINKYNSTIKEAALSNHEYSTILKLNIKVLTVSSLNSLYVIRYHSNSFDPLNGKVVNPTLRDAFQCLINYYSNN